MVRLTFQNYFPINRIAFEVSDTESEDEDSEEEGSDEWFD